MWRTHPVGDGFYCWRFRGVQCDGVGADDQSASGTQGGLVSAGAGWWRCEMRGGWSGDGRE